MGFQPMQAIFIIQYDVLTRKSKLAARGVDLFSGNKPCSNEEADRCAPGLVD